MNCDKIILGTVQMGAAYGINNTAGQIPNNESYKILEKAYECGVTTLDTAEGYGDSHKIIGDFHRANPYKIFSVITKIDSSNGFVNIEEKIRQYLDELSINKIEGLMFHSFESYKMHRNSLKQLNNLKREGLFNQLGVSIYTNDELKELTEDDEIDLIQLPFNMLDNFSLRGELLKKAKVKRKTIHTRSAFLQGLFFKNPNDTHKVVQALHPQLLKISEMAKEENASISALALSYCLRQPSIDKVLIGVDSLNQLKSNLEASQYKLEDKLVQTINQIEIQNIDLLNPSLWY